jgi:glucose-1-phosphate thymidylyltransferase
LLGTGEQFGVKFSYVEQPKPDGLARAFVLGEEFIGSDPVAMILGDNIFYGTGFSTVLEEVAEKAQGATVFAYKVKDPKRFGIVEFDQAGNVISVEEKPVEPKSNFAITGLYFYDNKVVEYAKNLQPSIRGEFEITDLNRIYLENKQLTVQDLGRGFVWLDTGTHRSLLQAAQYVQAVEENQGIKIACLEEVALIMGFLNKEQVLELISRYKNNEYYGYVAQILEHF